MHSVGFILSACVALGACSSPKTQQSPFDLYGITPAERGARDNDYYYTAPRAGSSCSTDGINSSPSCGGID